MFVTDFDNAFRNLKNKNIVVYGIGENTKLLLSNLKDYNFIGLLDRDPQNIGGKICNIEILDINQVINLPSVIIIIVASDVYWNIILKRLSSLLDKPNIEIYFQNGQKASIDYIHSSSKQESYNIFSTKSLYSQIKRYPIISFDLYDTLIMRKDILPNNNSTLKEEIMNIIPNSKMIKILNYALKLNKKVLIATDIYLSNNEIRQLLFSVGITANIELFNSSELNFSKANGDMWEYISKKYSPSSILHIGDNYISDIENSKKFGINSIYIPNTLNLINTSSISTLLFYLNTRDDKVVLQYIANTLFTNRFSSAITISSLYNFGYTLLGPLFFLYTIELLRKSLSTNITHILFFSRDGYLLKQCYNKVVKDFNIVNAPKPVYFNISARLIESASLFDISDITRLVGLREFEGTFADFLKTLFNINAEPDDPNIDKIIYTSKDILDMLDWINPYIDKILYASKTNRDNYLKYISSCNLPNGESILISDSGYTGSQQSLLSKITNQSYSGYYIYFKHINNIFNTGNISGLYDDNSTIRKLSKVIESVCTSSKGSIIFPTDSNKFEYSNKKSNQLLFNRKGYIRKGILTFIKDMSLAFNKDINNIDISKDFIDNIWKLFFCNEEILSNNIKDLLYFDTPYKECDEYKIL